MQGKQDVNNLKKVCVITCYAQPDYVRARTIRTSLEMLDDVEVIVVKNKHKGLMRYVEVTFKLIKTRLSVHPDIYILTFRGYEMLPVVRILTLGKKFVFDEFINLIEYVVYEHHKLKPSGLAARVLRANYRFWLKSTDLIVADTSSHADYSAQLMNIARDRYVPLIVSTDEETFKESTVQTVTNNNELKVFFYGLYMIPLHGLDVMLDAMRLLKNENITLHIIGGKALTAETIHDAQHQGVRVTYQQRVPYEDLVNYIHAADLCLGGPFGGTIQSQFVIGGKVFQFLKSGKPTIVGANKESGIFTDKKDTLVVEQANPKALADAILWAATHRSELVKVGQEGKKLYIKKLSNKILTEQLRELLACKELS